MSEITETFDFMPLGEAIKNAREKNGLTREQLAEQLGITPTPCAATSFNPKRIFCEFRPNLLIFSSDSGILKITS